MLNTQMKAAYRNISSILFIFTMLVLSASTLSAPVDTSAHILSINDTIKAQLDKEIRPIRNQIKRATALHDLMFGDDSWNIDYSSNKTFTAQQTFEKKLGNCMSLAALYVASARYVGLNAKFQTVEVPTNWEKREAYYIVPGHVNAVVFVPRHRVHVEFLTTFFDEQFDITQSVVISDEQAFAQFHNNVAMETIASGDYEYAKAQLETSTKLYSKYDYVWSNYGVVLKFSGDFENAERMYRKALKINRKNYSALSNLYILLNEQGRVDEAAKISSRVAKYSRKNPHHLAKLAKAALKTGNTKEALKLINKAIKKDKNVAYLHHMQAEVYSLQGKHKNALSALKNALKHAENEKEEQLYQKKVKQLLSLR